MTGSFPSRPQQSPGARHTLAQDMTSHGERQDIGRLSRPTPSSESKGSAPSFIRPRTLSKPEREQKPEQILGFDLENRGSAYWFDGKMTAEVTAIAWKWKHESGVHHLLLRYDGYWEGENHHRIPTDDAYELFRDELAKAGIVYGHNIRGHDLPLFQAGLLRRQLEPLQPVTTQDTLKDYPKRKDMSASLESLASMYGLSSGKKMPLTIPEWEEANRLTDRGLELTRQRVTSDVLLQEELYLKLRQMELLKPPRVWKP